jgi:hypothetical protein
MVGHQHLMIGHPLPGVPGVYDRMNQLAIIDIVGMEDILPPASTTNGTAG